MQSATFQSNNKVKTLTKKESVSGSYKDNDKLAFKAHCTCLLFILSLFSEVSLVGLIFINTFIN